MCNLYQRFDSNHIVNLENYTYIVEVESVITMD